MMRNNNLGYKLLKVLKICW